MTGYKPQYHIVLHQFPFKLCFLLSSSIVYWCNKNKHTNCLSCSLNIYVYLHFAVKFNLYEKKKMKKKISYALYFTRLLYVHCYLCEISIPAKRLFQFYYCLATIKIKSSLSLSRSSSLALGFWSEKKNNYTTHMWIHKAINWEENSGLIFKRLFWPVGIIVGWNFTFICGRVMMARAYVKWCKW